MRCVFFFLFSLLSIRAFSQVRLPRLISDGMVLQRDTRARIWGWAAPGEKVTLLFDGKEYHAAAGTHGRWELLLPPRKAGGPYELAFSASNRVTVKDVLFGNVWLCSGQSNMELPLQRVRYRYPETVAQANHPESANLKFRIPVISSRKETMFPPASGFRPRGTPPQIFRGWSHSFTETVGGLVAKGGGALRHFTIAGKDKKFVPAQALLRGNQVLVWSDAVKDPVLVRYAWADNPEGANLCNREGLPASPFEAAVTRR